MPSVMQTPPKSQLSFILIHEDLCSSVEMMDSESLSKCRDRKELAAISASLACKSGHGK